VVELFRWLFGGAAAPLKLAAVTAAVATTATLSVVVGHKSAPVAPVIVKHSAVVPASTVRPRDVAHSAARPAATRAVAEQSPGPTLAIPITPAGQPAASGPDAQPVLSSSGVEPAIATAVPTVSVPDLTTPEVTLPTVTVPGITLPAVTVPAVVLPNVQLPTTPDLPKLP
jgi:hypothetical protein